MRNGAPLWAECDRVSNLQRLLQQNSGHVFISFEGQTINTADIVGIFSAETMGELTTRKNGKWQCRFSEWHKCGDDCNCPDQKLKVMYKERREIIQACQICIGQGHKGLLDVEGKKIYDRCDCNGEITNRMSNGSSATSSTTSVRRISLDKNRD